MAAVSAAMLRPPGGGLDPPYYTTQMMNYSPTEDSKSKKSWGQRLKLGQSSNSNGSGGTVRSSNPNLYGTLSVPGGSALSKSMKYAEPWLYGTVRANSTPVRPAVYLQYAEQPSPVLLSTPQTPVQNYAVVVCSCPEYLNGTKKGSSKKVSICKKCKGSRLPLGVAMNGTIGGQVMGGTMRGPPTVMSPGGTVRAGTVKLQPTTKSRPTILSLASPNQASDPYDLMRRTRLSSPLDSAQVGSQFTASRSRAKSISPVRNRGRRRSPSNDTLKLRSKSVSRSKDLWFEDIQNYENEMNNRRSILECDVNPYDLMHKSKTEKLRSQQEEDDEVFGDLDNDDTFNLKKLQKNLSNRQNKKGMGHNGPYSNIQAIGGQRIRIFGESSSMKLDEDFVYDDVDVNQSKQNGSSRIEMKQDELNDVNVSKALSGGREQKMESTRSAKVTIASPKRPPRKNKMETSEEESESDRKESKQKIVTKQLTVNNSSAAFVANRSSAADPTIKSILKKPRGDRPVQNGEQPSVRTPQPDRALSGSHFYLPTPPASKSSGIVQSSALQRKKVQFLVENEIVSSSHQVVDDENLVLSADEASDASLFDEESASRNNERKSSLQSDDWPEEDPIVGSSGNHNLVNVHYAKNNQQPDGQTGNHNDDVRFESKGSEAGKDEPVERGSDAQGSNDEAKIHTQKTSAAESCSVVKHEEGRSTELSSDNESTTSGRAVMLRRSQSERLTLEGSPEPPSFLDTMALRPRPSRAHSRQVFISTQSLVEIINVDKPSRPKDRPPPPPPQPNADAEKQSSTMSSVTILCNDHVDQNESRSKSIVPIIKEPDSDKNVRSQKIRIGTLPAAPPRSRSREKKSHLIPSKKEPNYVKTRFIRDKNIMLDELSTVAFDADERTTVKVSAEASPQVYESRTIHRLSVTQNDENGDDSTNDDSHRKTSIMISGDDCYSTVNVSNDTPIYQSSVTINTESDSKSAKSSRNTVTISVYSESDDSNSDIATRHNNQIYIHDSGSNSSYEVEKSKDLSDPPNQNKTLVVLDYETMNADDKRDDPEVQKEDTKPVEDKEEEVMKRPYQIDGMTTRGTRCNENISDMNSTSEEISILLRDPVEAVKRNLVPHVCGKAINETSNKPKELIDNPIKSESELKNLTRNTFVSKLLEDPMLGHLAEGLETDLVARLIENSLMRLKESRKTADYKTNEDDDAMSRLIDASLLKLQEERSSLTRADEKLDLLLKDSEKTDVPPDEKCESQPSSNRDSICSQTNTTGNNNCSPPYESMEYESGLMGTSSDVEPLSDCYNASASELSTEEDNTTRSKFYQMLVDATLSEIEISHNLDDDHHYESIRLNSDPIYEEISDIPPPLPLSPPPASLSTMDDDKKSRSIFEGASKYDILSYLVDAKERGIVPEDSYSFNSTSEMAIEEDGENKERIDHQRQSSDLSSRVSNLSNGSDSSEDNSLIITNLDSDKAASKKSSTEIERNDSGVGSETSKCSRSRWQGHNIPPNSVLDNATPIHLCEDCDGAVETQITESGVMYAPLVCRKCGKKRAERKEIITEIVETEEKYGRDLQIILEEFYQPMLVAGLLTQEQLSTIFLNVEELLENNQSLAERLRDALEIALEQGDEDLLTVNIGKLMLECTPMLHAFSSYCVRQGAASMLLSSLEKEKELLRIFLKVSQMENAVLRRMNLNSFLMVPVQRVTKYPLLLSRLFKVTPHHLEGREQLRQAQQKIEQHLSHMNSEAKDVTTLKLWRRISSNTGARRSSSEMDMINIKLRKLAVDVLEWNHDEARFAMEGKLLFTQPNDNNWRKGRTIKLTPINALLVTNGKPTTAYKPNENRGPCFPRNTGVREASLVLARDKGGRAALLREPLYLDRCVVAAESDWDDYFELQEIVSKDTYIFKAEDSARTKQWCQQLQYHCQGMGAWRKRRNALANIMINGMMTRN